MHDASWQLFCGLMVIALVLQAYFTMMEMAFVSFNRVRLQYYVAKGSKRAKWLSQLLARPTYLFGTTLIGVNLFLQLGSQASQLFYDSLGLPAHYAILTEVVLIVIFAELAPMFAARSHSEHVAMFGIGPIYFLSKLCTPFIWFLQGICRIIDWILRTPAGSGHYLTREELQKAIEGKKETVKGYKQEEFDALIRNIFTLKQKTPKELMIPLEDVKMVSYCVKAKELKSFLSDKYYRPFFPLFYEKRENIFGVLYTRDLLRLTDEDDVRDVVRSVWFITETNSIFQILKQFRRNNQHLAVVLNSEGQAIGVLELDRLIDQIFHEEREDSPLHAKILVDRAFPASSLIEEINQSLGLDLPTEHGESLEDLMTYLLGHYPRRGEMVHVNSVDLILESARLLADKTIRIHTHATSH